jgi:dolichol-phosphate mannosyltransferase
MDNATGDCVVVIDSDLQDPPEVISDLLRAWANGGDVVHAVRTERQGASRAKRMLASSFYRTIGRLTDIELVPDSGDFRLYDRRAVDALRAMPERQRFLRGMAAWVGYRQVRVPYRRDARAAGTSKYPIRRSLRLAVTAITSFSWVPLQFASAFGFILSVAAACAIPVLIVLRLIGVEGLGNQTTILVAVLFLGGVQLLFLGVIGEYIGRMSEEVKQRPAYILSSDSAAPMHRPADPFRSAPPPQGEQRRPDGQVEPSQHASLEPAESPGHPGHGPVPALVADLAAAPAQQQGGSGQPGEEVGETIDLNAGTGQEGPEVVPLVAAEVADGDVMVAPQLREGGHGDHQV